MLPDLLLSPHARQHSVGTTMIQGDKEQTTETDFGSVLSELALEDGDHPANEEAEIKANPEAEIGPEDIDSAPDFVADEAFELASMTQISRGDDSVGMRGAPETGPAMLDALAVKDSVKIGALTQNDIAPERTGVVSARESVSVPPVLGKMLGPEDSSGFPLNRESADLRRQKAGTAPPSKDTRTQSANVEPDPGADLAKMVPANQAASQETQTATLRTVQGEVAPTATALWGREAGDMPRGRPFEALQGTMTVTDTSATIDTRAAPALGEHQRSGEALRQHDFGDPKGAPPPDRQDAPVTRTAPPLGTASPTPMMASQAGLVPLPGAMEKVDSEQIMTQGLEETLSLSERFSVGGRETVGMPRVTGIHANSAPSQGLLVVRQVSEAVRLTPGAGVEIALSPEELGSVRLRLTGADGQMAVVVQAERPETLDLMRRHIDTLSQDFRDIGYGDVTFSFQSGEDRQHGAEKEGASPVLMVEETTPARQELDRSALAMGGGLDIRI